MSLKTVLAAFVISALLIVHMLIGGTRLLFSLPGYGVLAAAALLAAFHRPSLAARPALSALIGAGLLCGYIAGRAMLSPVEYLWWPDFYLVLACTIAYLLVACHLTSAEERNWILAALMLFALAQVLVAVRQFSAGDDFMPLGLRRAAGGRRASGFLISPNHLAGYLEMIGVMALSCACWSPWRGWARILSGYVAAACYVGVALTGSRGGYLSTAFSLLVFGMLSVGVIAVSDRARAMRFALLGMILAIGAGVATLNLMSGNPALKARLDTLGDQFSGGQLDVRIYNWQAARDQFQLAPALGTGAGTHLYLGRYFRRARIQNDPVHAHCDYLELLAEYGIAGAAVMAIFLATHLRAGFRRLTGVVHQELRSRGSLLNDDIAHSVGALSGVAAMAMHSVVDFNLHVPGNALVMAFLFALLAGPAAAGGTAGKAEFIFGRLALPALGLWLAVSGLPKLPGEYWAEETRKAMHRSDPMRTSAVAQKALQWEHRNPYTYFYLGESKRAVGSAARLRALRTVPLQAAVDAYRHSLAIFPQDETTWVRLGQTLDGLKDLSGAETAYLTALEMDPNFGILHAYYAAHLRLCGRFADAEARLRQGQLLTGMNLAPIVDRALDAPEFIRP